MFDRKGAWGMQLLGKEIPTQVISCEFCEIFKNTFSAEQLRAITFKLLLN